MEIKQIKCPSCGSTLSIRNSTNDAVKFITCPICKAGLKVTFHRNTGETILNGNQENGQTQLGQSCNGDTTILAGSKEKKSKEPCLVYEGKSYPLALGDNIVGRKAATSTATVQIETTDRYMSRQHAKITVVSLPDGSMKTVIRNYHNKNATTVNGQKLNTDDAIVLNNEYTIIMGKTTINYRTTL